MKRSVFLKIFTGYCIVTCFFAAAFTFISFRTIKSIHLEAQTRTLVSLGESLIPEIRPFLQSGRTIELDTRLKKLAERIPQVHFSVVAPSGAMLADSRRDPAAADNQKTRSEVLQALYGKTGTDVRRDKALNASVLHTALPVRREAAIRGVLCLSISLDDFRSIAGDLREDIVTTMMLILALGLLISFVTSRRLTDPVRKLREASQRVAAGDFNVRVFLKYKDEMHDFADSFNYMTEKIRNLFGEVSMQKEELKNIISSMHEGLLVVDRDDRIVLYNESLKSITRTEGVEGLFYWEVLREPQFGSILKRVRAERRDIVEEVPLDDRTFVCSASFIEPKEEIVFILLDVSAMKNIERMKKDFVVNVSHELRTPLTAIKGFIETMLEEVQDSEHRRYLDIIKRHTDRLINIVKDLMMLSNLEKEKKIEQDDVYLKSVIEQSRKIYDQRLKEKNLSLKIQEHDERLHIKADPYKLEQMFTNLIDNAIKYTEKGGILINIRAAGTHAEVTVEDTGIGIARDQHSKIFERFYVVDKSRSRRVGGTGLGLSIVKHIVLLHKGSIDVESSPGVGTKFTIKLPIDMH